LAHESRRGPFKGDNGPLAAEGQVSCASARVKNNKFQAGRRGSPARERAVAARACSVRAVHTWERDLPGMQREGLLRVRGLGACLRGSSHANAGAAKLGGEVLRNKRGRGRRAARANYKSRGTVRLVSACVAGAKAGRPWPGPIPAQQEGGRAGVAREQRTAASRLRQEGTDGGPRDGSAGE
jgi:hypothetical protein